MEPGALGHEGWGRIVALGAGVADRRIGQRVAILSAHAYAEYDVAPAQATLPLDGLPESRAFPGEALGCAMNVFRRSEIRAGQRVAIVGLGFLGLLLAGLAAAAGATVFGAGRREGGRGLALSRGAAEVFSLEERDEALSRIGRLTEGRLCDVVIEATGHQAPLDLAAELTRERGRLVIAGYHQDGPRQVNLQLWNWRGLDVINAHERDPAVYLEGMAEAREAVRSGRLDCASLFTHRFGLGELGLALEMTARRPDGFVKALICYDENGCA
jgi:threonine dehydrogenase-like Zn-dependent dehydrogenase